ncbi:MAG: glycoside hydrolase family 13 protein [Clostridia bacterium]|nr:glycoside hydrolase family 13 protein [Clostridia bacterium]
MNYYPFDSQNKLYKEKAGALACGENFTPRLLLHKDALVHDAYLFITKDGEDTMEYKMARKGQVEDYVVFEFSIALDTGIYHYGFRYDSEYGHFFVVRENATRGIVSKEKGKTWQQTVYNTTSDNLEWLKGGIIYQIFPDRFYNSGEEKKNVPNDRYIRNDWGGTPLYRQNDTKETLCNDYFGGDLKGICEKLPYIKSLGVNLIYLNPIFEAHSNHRYNTADYFNVDSLLGTNEDFKNLCKCADKMGIKIILDGVFSHTGDDSIYFNKKGRYKSIGAYESENSPYYSWYKFGKTRDEYDSWWGVKTLPEVNEENNSYIDFICGENGVVRHWMKMGAKGFRLDVADELPDIFLDALNKTVKETDKEAFILGEVWENATNKVSYGKRRRYLLGNQLDSVMNYPFANGIVDYVRSGNALALLDTVKEICDEYPPLSLNLLMNHLSTHDTARILTRLAYNSDDLGDRETQAKLTLNKEQYEFGKKRLFTSAVLQYTLPGIPSVFYGDEAGLSGGFDPFCRGCYPWGKEDNELLLFYRELGRVRNSLSPLKEGVFSEYIVSGGLFSFLRSDKENVLVATNVAESSVDFEVPNGYKTVFSNYNEKEKLLPSYGYLIAIKKGP